MKSFLEGRQVVSRQVPSTDRASGFLPSLGQSAEDSTVPSLPRYSPPAALAKHTHEKKVETVTVDGVVQKIIVTCGCGERIEVHCGY